MTAAEAAQIVVLMALVTNVLTLISYSKMAPTQLQNVSNNAHLDIQLQLALTNVNNVQQQTVASAPPMDSAQNAWTASS